MKNHHKLLCTAAAVAITVALSGPIMAADAPVRKGPAPIAAPMFDWSGFYVGGHVGYGQSKFDGNANAGSTVISPKPKGFLVGLHAGQNIQAAANWLWGWEADLDVMNWSATLETDPATSSHVTGHVGGTASLRGRLGWIFDRTLIYATGGIAAAAWNGRANDPSPRPWQ